MGVRTPILASLDLWIHAAGLLVIVSLDLGWDSHIRCSNPMA